MRFSYASLRSEYTEFIHNISPKTASDIFDAHASITCSSQSRGPCCPVLGRSGGLWKHGSDVWLLPSRSQTILHQFEIQCCQRDSDFSLLQVLVASETTGLLTLGQIARDSLQVNIILKPLIVIYYHSIILSFHHELNPDGFCCSILCWNQQRKNMHCNCGRADGIFLSGLLLKTMVLSVINKSTNIFEIQ